MFRGFILLTQLPWSGLWEEVSFHGRVAEKSVNGLALTQLGRRDCW